MMANKWLVLTTAIFFATRVPAAQPSISALEACTNLADDHERLTCFDRAMASRGVTTAAGVAAPVPKLTQEQKLGLPQEKIEKLEARNDTAPRAPAIKKFQAHLSSITVNNANRQVFTLDNGQIWQQIEADSAFAARTGDTVEISKGTFGSFFLSVGKHASTRVRRVS